MKQFDAWMKLGVEYEGTEEEYAEESAYKLTELAVFCLGDQRPDLRELDEDGDMKALDILDQLTVFKIIEICGGIKLNDPKLMEMAIKAADQAGTN